MNQYTMVFLIVVTVMSSLAFKNWVQMKSDQAKAKMNELGDEASRKIAELEERVKVLERIATDKSSRLSEEIDAL
ncbi:hypothetical protein KFE96_07585 [Kordiimonas sp. SCSIO 12603]|uniref:hypothetical protein n=1 Tax=Kordiimonas sp. SCSIO 12603 TaxID=2829596 RepID=UPI00210443F8|nr:hypothetical protein [Kordiimonas sp. SCSIO 12603]UTW60164.1 hypothetical protein KFE96_07585 [Kordiimonas sp. SCSIO 12603]